MTISATTQGLRPGVCTSTSRPSAPFDGMMIYETDTNTLAVYDGSGWVSLNPVDRDRNVVINGAMQVAQRSTSVTGITGLGYNTADRWYQGTSSLGTWTQTVENDAPTGSGLRKSLKVLCTTADASPAAGDYLFIRQYLEGQNCQKFKKGTSSAERLTLSFWVKSSTTGTFVAELEDVDGGRWISQSYTVSVADTWEKKTLTYVGDTSTAIDNDNNYGIAVTFWLGAGSTYSGGSSLNTSWGTTVNTRAVGQTNLAGATNRYWQVTGVQLEVGAVATPFEFEDYGTTLAKCQRYFQQNGGAYHVCSNAGLSNSYATAVSFPVVMRGDPTVTIFSGVDFGGTSGSVAWYPGPTTAAATFEQLRPTGFVYLRAGVSTHNLAVVSWKASSEL